MIDKNVKNQIDCYYDKEIMELDTKLKKRKEMLISELVNQFERNEIVKQINTLTDKIKDIFYYLDIRYNLCVYKYSPLHDDYKEDMFSNDKQIQKIIKEIDKLKLEKRNLILKLSSVRAGTKEYKEIIDKFIKLI